MPSQMFVLTVAAGKRLIAKGIAQNPIVKNAIETHKLVVIAGTTNAYVMQELCPGQDTAGFYRGTTTAPGKALPIRDGLCDCVVTKDGVDASRIEAYIKRKDAQHNNYNKFFTDKVWGDPKNYDLMLNTSALGYEAAAEAIIAVMNARGE